jgi:alkanesulfonate monooxygenase SsuD/methylene tetrahydromethanopterin reductase-like flavin-dependent oxidoreductase (luciferase family)
VNYGLDIQNHGPYADPRLLVELAREAEYAGWDGIFLWDHLSLGHRDQGPFVDPLVALSAIAATTERIRIGTVVTPIARRRPWKLAKELVSLDHLSGGRVTLGAGLGWSSDIDFSQFGEEGNPRIRAQKLDEALEVIVGLWTGEIFNYEGAHYQVHEAQFLPSPVQVPRIPVWLAGTWPAQTPFRRAATWDGAFPLKAGPGPTDWVVPVNDIAEIRQVILRDRPASPPFDLVAAGITGGTSPRVDAELVGEYESAGATWWLEALIEARGPVDDARQRVRAGPPRG